MHPSNMVYFSRECTRSHEGEQRLAMIKSGSTRVELSLVQFIYSCMQLIIIQTGSDKRAPRQHT